MALIKEEEEDSVEVEVEGLVKEEVDYLVKEEEEEDLTKEAEEEDLVKEEEEEEGEEALAKDHITKAITSPAKLTSEEVIISAKELGI